MKSMKLVSALFALFLLAAPVVSNAQNGKRGENKKPRSENRMENMQKELDLTADQVAQIQKMWDENSKERETLQKTRENSRDEFRQEMKSMRDKHEAKMKEILTPEQYKKYQEKQKQQMQNRRSGNRGQQGRNK